MKHHFKKFIGNAIAEDLYRRGKIILSLNDPEKKRVFDLVRKVRTETKMKLSDAEAYNIHAMVKTTGKIPGDIAEVGTFRGASGKLICEAKGDRTAHFFDTFEGLPALSAIDDPGQLRKGTYSASLEEVKSFLRGYPNTNFYKGVFPETAAPIAEKTFSFVHMDVDLYESTLRCIEFFYPRMSKGGVMISHDYPNLLGVKKAFDEFFKDKPEIVIELLGCRQCLVVKV